LTMKKKNSTRHSTRQIRTTERLQRYRDETGRNYSQRETGGNSQHGLNTIECDESNARALPQVILYQKELTTTMKEQSHATTYTLKSAIKKFGDKAKQAATTEMQQLHDRQCWKPIDFQTMTPFLHRREIRKQIEGPNMRRLQ
jgi:hypothetical protein